MSISLLQSHPRFTPKQVTQEILTRPPVPMRSKADCPPQLTWFVDHVLEKVAEPKGILAMIAAGITRVEVIDIVPSCGGMSIKSDTSAQRRSKEACVLYIARAQMATMQNYMHQCDPHNAIRTARFGLEEAIKDNLIRAAAEDEQALANFKPLAGASLIGLVENMKPNPTELKNLLQLVPSTETVVQ